MRHPTPSSLPFEIHGICRKQIAQLLSRDVLPLQISTPHPRQVAALDVGSTSCFLRHSVASHEREKIARPHRPPWQRATPHARTPNSSGIPRTVSESHSSQNPGWTRRVRATLDGVRCVLLLFRDFPALRIRAAHCFSASVCPIG